MRNFELTAHAKIVIAERAIKEEWIERVLLNPEKVVSMSTVIDGAVIRLFDGAQSGGVELVSWVAEAG